MEFKSFIAGSTKNPSAAINSVFPFSRKRPGEEDGERVGEKKKIENYFSLAYSSSSTNEPTLFDR